MASLSFASLPRSAFGVPDTRIPVDPAAIISYILPPVICFFVAALLAVTPQTRAARLALWPLIVLLTIRAALSVDMPNGRFERKPLNMSLSMFMVFVIVRSLEWAWEKEPQRRISRHSNSSTFKDAIDLVLNYRGLGWEWSRGLYVPPETRPTDRTAFVVCTAISAFAHTILCGTLHRAIQTLVPIGIGSNPEAPTVFDETLPPLLRYLRSSVISTSTAVLIYAGVQIMHDCGTVFAILILGQEPADWPPIFHSPWFATSLSDFWARRWHQYLRGTLLFLSRPLSLLFGRVGSVIGGFFVSGVLHHLMMLSLNDQMECRWMMVGFGMMAPGVLAERAFYRLTGRRVGGVLGWIWTMSWLLSLGHVLVEGFARAGFFGCIDAVDSILPVRIPVERLVKEFDLWLHTL